MKTKKELFLEKIDKTPTCWIWTGGLTANGYGSFFNQRKTTSAHRYSYLIHTGQIPAGLPITHSCGVKTCVNPDHLRTKKL